MKKVINGHSYDTNTAKQLGYHDADCSCTDFAWYEETLYRTKAGYFFLHGSGNAASKYSKSCGQNEWCGSEAIVPISEQEAKSWAEKHLDGDAYEGIFGAVDSGTTGVLVNIPDPLLSRVDAACSEQNVTRTGFILDALRAALKSN